MGRSTTVLVARYEELTFPEEELIEAREPPP